MSYLPQSYEGQDVRMHVEKDTPWFCLVDVARILNLNPKNFQRSKFCDPEGVCLTHSPTKSGSQKMVFISESNLIAMVMRSEKPEAIAFQRWVTKEVLPAIRKTGGYVAPVVHSDPLLASIEALGVVRREQLETTAKVAELDERLAALESRPKITIVDGSPNKTRVKNLVAHIAVLSGNEAREIYHQAYRQLEHELQIELVPGKKKTKCKSILEFVESQGWLGELTTILEEMSR